MYLKIINVHAREILDSRGNPTVQAEVTVQPEGKLNYIKGVASVPSGASTGKFEAVELRDGEVRYFGLGVENAVQNVNTKIKDALVGKNAFLQRMIDETMLEIDGTDNKANLGANAMLSVSIACAKACANAMGIPLYRYLGGSNGHKLPIPMMNILNGGVHADNTVDLQEFMIMPINAPNFKDGLRRCAEVYHNLKGLCKAKGLSTAVGDEGGFAPNLVNTEEALKLISEAIETAGYTVGEDFVFAIDAAASELFDEESKLYHFPGESAMLGKKVTRTSAEMISYYETLAEQFPIFSIEDGLNEEDWDGWQALTKKLGSKMQLVGDDLFVTNTKRLKAGIQLKAGNAILVKVNQIGTLTEAMDAVTMAQQNGFKTIISHRSGETEDTTISDLAVALNAGQIKTGAPARSERVAKYNRLLQIEEEINYKF